MNGPPGSSMTTPLSACWARLPLATSWRELRGGRDEAVVNYETEGVMNVEETGAVMSVDDDDSTLRATLDIGGRIKRNPYGMMAGALGMGFVLGGGLFTRLTARIFGAGLRIGLMAALPLLQKGLVQPVKGGVANGRQPAGAGDGATGRA
jgi:hypothetical protein